MNSKTISTASIIVSWCLSVLLLLADTSAQTTRTRQPILDVWGTNGPNANVRSVVVDPNNFNNIYAVSSTGIFKSVTNGESWFLASPIIAKDLAVDPSSTNTLFAATINGVFKSVDGGFTWNSVNLSVNTSLIKVSSSDPNIIYAGEYKFSNTPSVFVTMNGGLTWDARPLPDTFSQVWFKCIEVDPQNPNVLYAYVFNWDDMLALFRSTNQGRSWTRLGYVGTAMINTSNLKIDSANPNVVYAATVWGIYRSIDGGSNWMFRGSFGSSVAFALDPVASGTLYASGEHVPVVKSKDAGISWEWIDQGLTNSYVKDLTFDRSGRFLHAATSSGVFSIRVRADASASNASVSGRVLTPDNRGLSNATVLMTDPAGATRTVTSSSFGYFSFAAVPIGASYTLTVRSRRYRFAPRNFTLTSDLTDLNMIGIG